MISYSFKYLSLLAVHTMLYTITLALITFASTFMVADTVANIWQLLNSGRVALISYSVWMAALTLTVLGADWLTTLGFVHALIFVACWWLVRDGDNPAHSSPSRDDYVRFPVTVYVPAFVVLYFLQGWLQ
ncbi:hypothetical protein, unknown function [Leishmania infantum JPCM5]|uniref:Uncharacterized protein n=4 Tax=Leishmania donovani species complex TaxID=38574 RepID=E9AHG3_LEIIN|nr:hypothetical protein, unknown function [Leishmania infantum JPCM5]CBZ08845.1 hypothetical protein, unknown function [Leishmania infantum JPCM5]|eukprot:XP_003392664.1 hypothetical protein, unknown function [Leishmania infantum JPCM5]